MEGAADPRDALTEERVARARAEGRADALASALAAAEAREAAAMVELAALRAGLVEADEILEGPHPSQDVAHASSRRSASHRS